MVHLFLNCPSEVYSNDSQEVKRREYMSLIGWVPIPAIGVGSKTILKTQMLHFYVLWLTGVPQTRGEHWRSCYSQEISARFFFLLNKSSQLHNLQLLQQMVSFFQKKNLLDYSYHYEPTSKLAIYGEYSKFPQKPWANSHADKDDFCCYCLLLFGFFHFWFIIV